MTRKEVYIKKVLYIAILKISFGSYVIIKLMVNIKSYTYIYFRGILHILKDILYERFFVPVCKNLDSIKWKYIIVYTCIEY